MHLREVLRSSSTLFSQVLNYLLAEAFQGPFLRFSTAAKGGAIKLYREHFLTVHTGYVTLQVTEHDLITGSRDCNKGTETLKKVFEGSS